MPVSAKAAARLAAVVDFPSPGSELDTMSTRTSSVTPATVRLFRRMR